jgi:hypothetical protein
MTDSSASSDIYFEKSFNKSKPLLKEKDSFHGKIASTIRSIGL